MHISELRVDPILINMPTRCVSSNGDIKTYRIVLVLSKSNFDVDSTSHYKESIVLQYFMYITMRH